jgi:hypothetical protein
VDYYDKRKNELGTIADNTLSYYDKRKGELESQRKSVELDTTPGTARYEYIRKAEEGGVECF